MANANVAFGLKPVRMAGGGPYNGSANMYYHQASDGTALYIGDPVIKDGSSDASGQYASVIRGSAGGPFTGVVVGFVPDGTVNMTAYGAASTAFYVLVCDDPNVLYEITEDAVGGSLAAADIGLNASVIAASGSSYSKRSGFMLDTSTKATTAGLELKIVGLVPRPDNALTANSKVLVRINDHTEPNATAGI